MNSRSTSLVEYFDAISYKSSAKQINFEHKKFSSTLLSKLSYLFFNNSKAQFFNKISFKISQIQYRLYPNLLLKVAHLV